MEEESISGLAFGEGDLGMPLLARFDSPKDILHSGVDGIGIAEGLVLVVRGIHTV